MKGRSTKDILLEHSSVKVELYVKYLSKYLSILKRAGFCDKIHLYDLMCGEGIYADNGKGSPILALETIKNHYYSNEKSCIAMNVWFNDYGASDVEKGKNKIERVQSACNPIFKPNNVLVSYTNLDFVSEIYPKLSPKIKGLKNEKLLLFLYPYAYKDITPNHIKNILCNSNVELLLFVPITPMYRFANKSLKNEEFRGGDSLSKMLEILLNGEDKFFNSERDFIQTLKEKYRTFLDDKFFVDTFTIQRDKSNTYALFFFTPHVKGFETMLKTKWEMDEKRGEGFKIGNANQISIFGDDVISFSQYPEKLRNHIKQGNGTITNSNLYTFGLRNRYLPSHSVEVLKGRQKNNPNLKVLENGKDARKSAFYIGYDYYKKKKEKEVNFTFLNK